MLKRKLTTTILVATLFVGSTIAPLAAQQSSQSMKSDNKMSDGTMKDNKMGDGMMKDNKMAANKMSNKKQGKHKRHPKHKSNDTMQKNKNQ